MSTLPSYCRKRLTIGRLMAAGVMLVVGGASGCTEPTTVFDIVNVKGVGDREHFHQPFDECYYTVARGGQIDIVARRVEGGGSGAGGGEARVTQLIHVQTAYRAVPGTTAAEESMINATVTYAVLDARGGVCYEGAGFVATDEAPEQGLMVGALERAPLEENRIAGSGGGVFRRVELTGTYQAVRSRRRVMALLNELNRVFGPQPDYRPAPRDNDPL